MNEEDNSTENNVYVLKSLKKALIMGDHEVIIRLNELEKQIEWKWFKKIKNLIRILFEDAVNVKNTVNENNDGSINSEDVVNVKNAVNKNNDAEEQFLCALREDPFVVGNIKDLEDEDLKKFIANLKDAKKQRTFIQHTANAMRKPFFFVLEFIFAVLGRVLFYVCMIPVLTTIICLYIAINFLIASIALVVWIVSFILFFALLCILLSISLGLLSCGLSGFLICIACVVMAIPISIIWLLSPILRLTGAYKNILKGVFHMSEDQAVNWNNWAGLECIAGIVLLIITVLVVAGCGMLSIGLMALCLTGIIALIESYTELTKKYFSKIKQKSDESDGEFKKEVDDCIEGFMDKAIMYTEVIEWIQNEENEKNEKELEM
ncbi:24636_t:CDS:2 [Gigaspora margarita]|uniref:24636_t:CDS:1 n=1 Tax=Gigaspora margarita TaxID=4874 RepID=A0ABN7V546_GIGMA|nr:24636_t:CDS:2 [Gigaspora margarita]